MQKFPVEPLDITPPVKSYRRFLAYLLLVAAYVISGKLGLMLALPPGYSSPIFPPAGIAVAAAFIGGRRTLPWIFSGALLLNLWVGYSSSQQFSATGLVAASVIAIASMLQAGLGGWWLRRMIGYPSAMDNGLDVLRFIFLAALICLTSASLSVSALSALGVIDMASFASNWFSWWVGDTLGVMVMLPLVMVMVGEPRTLWRSRARSVALPIVLIFTLFVVIFIRVNKWEREDSLMEFHIQSQQIVDQTRTSLEEQESLVEQMAGLFLHDQDGPPSREEFRRFIRKSLTRFPKIQAMEWAPHVDASQRANFELAQGHEFPGFEIREFDNTGRLQRAGARNHYYPVTYVEPFSTNKPALGFDLASTAERQKALTKAIESGALVASSPLHLVQEREQQAGILLFLAVKFADDKPGVVLSVLRMGDFMEKLMQSGKSSICVRLVDMDAQKTIYDSFGAGSAATLFERRFQFGTRRYLIQTTPTQSYFMQHRSWQSWGVLAAGIFGTGLLGALLMLGTGHTARVEVQVKERTRELRENEARLSEITSTLGEGVIVLDELGCITFVNPEAQRLLGWSEEELINQDAHLMFHYQKADGTTYPKDACRILRVTRSGEPYRSEDDVFWRKNGSPLPVSVTSSPILRQEKVVGSVVAFNDITERKHAEAALRTLSKAIEQSPASVVITDPDANIEYVNPRFTEVTGYKLEEVIGKNPRVLKSGLTPEETYREMWNSLTRGQAWCGELLNKRKNGEHYWEEAHLAPVQNSAGVTTHYVAVKTEITERKQNEKAIQQNEARLRFMLETSPIAVRIASSSGRKVLFANQRYTELINSERDKVIGIDPKGYYVNPGDYDAVLERLSKGEYVTNKLVELRIPGAKSKWALASYMVMEFENESAVLGWFYDITELKQMETALRNSEMRLTVAQRIAHIGNWELDLIHNRLWWSEEIFRIFEIDPGQFEASYKAFLSTIHPDDREVVNQAYLDSLDNKQPYEIEHRLLLPDGKVKFVHERCETEFDENGKPLRSLGTVQDITERKLVDAALQQSEGTARALINATMETAMLLDKSGTVLAINEVGTRRLRKKQDEVIGSNFYDLLPPDLAASRKSYAQQVFQSGKPAHLQDIRDGIHFDISVYPVFDQAGKVVNIAVYAADITEQFQLQGVDKLIHGIDQQALRGQSIQEIFKYACAEVSRIFGYQLAWIGRKESDGSVSILSWAGSAAGYHDELERIGVRWDDTPQGLGATGTAIRTGLPQVLQSSDSGFNPWRESAERHDLKALVGLPLVIRDEVYGAFMLYSRYGHSFDDPALLERLSGIASRICVALEMAMDQQQLMLLGTALAATANGVFITDKAGHILWVNNAFTLLTGYAEAEALGASPSILNSGKQNAVFYQNLWRTILNGNVWRNEMEERHRDGSEIFVRQTITPIQDATGEVTHFVAILEDISAEREAEARIEYMAHYDSLTDLPNRALFMDRLSQTLSLAKRGNHPAALMFLDLDRFKSVNDTLGHHAGDRLLHEVAVRLKACVRESDTVARLAGDEFTILLPEVAVREDAASVAEKIITAFSQPFDIEGHEIYSSTSIGIALYPKNAVNGEGLLKCADTAMYAAKESGRNKFCFYVK